MNDIKYSPMAQKDLDEIWEYIAKNLTNPIAATNTIYGIIDTIDVLQKQSEIGTPLYFGSGLFSGYRYVVYKNYLAFYRTVNNTIYVDRVIYGKRDYMKILFND